MCVFLTYERAPFGVEFGGYADVGAQVQHDEHGNDHDDALQQQQRVEVATESVEEKTEEAAMTRVGGYGTRTASGTLTSW